ncbi:hypothetical protein, partial [Viridibacillus arenosi]|uniref:hypothetical protein n=1 Tax=Viridibacillus arenosi TaxID=263476 RepID=UPI001C4D2F1A
PIESGASVVSVFEHPMGAFIYVIGFSKVRFFIHTCIYGFTVSCLCCLLLLKDGDLNVSKSYYIFFAERWSW